MAVGFLAVLAALWVYNGPGPAASGETTTVVLRKGSSLPEIASSLLFLLVMGSS